MKGLFLVSIMSVILSVQCQFYESLLGDRNQETIAAHRECSAITGVDPVQAEWAKYGLFEDNPKLKEHLFCISKKLGFLNEAGDPQVDTVKAKFVEVLQDKAFAKEIATKCAIKKDSPQQTAFDLFDCYYDSLSINIGLA